MIFLKHLMRVKHPIILISLVIVLFISCSSSKKPANDSDVISDADSDSTEKKENIVDEDFSQDSDVVDDKDQSSDSDSDDSDYESSKPSQEEHDNDFAYPVDEGDPDYEKLWLTDDDPYADRENFLYKYYGNYDVVADDPEHVRATLWKYEFLSPNGGFILNLCSKYNIHPYEACADNYPFEPILIEDWPNQDDTVVKNENILKNKCDGLMTPEKRWQNDWIYGRDPEYFAKNGKVVFTMDSYYAPILSTFVFDIQKRQLIKIGDGAANLDFNGKMILMSTYNKSINDDSPNLPNYQMPVQEVIYYDIEKHKYGYAWYGEKFYGINYMGLGDTYAMMSYQTKPNDSGEMKVVYTNIGDWKNWKELKKFTDNGQDWVAAIYPNFYGSQVVFLNYAVAAIFCDLEKGDDGCVKVSDETEKAYSPKMIGDRKIIYISTTYDEQGKELNNIIQVELNKDGSVKSRDVLIHDDRINAIRDVNNDFLLYSIKIGETENEHPISAPCYYRFSDKKTVCLDSDEDAVFTKHYSYMPGYGRYLVYQHYFDYVLRDMECYCDYHPDRCPYSDYKPNPGNPKVPVWRKK